MVNYYKKLMGLKIKKAREDKKLTQDDLALQLNMNRASISSYEAGRAVPPGNTLRNLADLLDVSADYLLGRATEDDGLLAISLVPSIGAAIKAERLAQNMSQQELGKAAGISQNEISQYERDIIPLSEPIAEKLARAFSLPLSEFLEKYGLYCLSDGSLSGDNLSDERSETESDSIPAENSPLETIAAHHDGEAWNTEKLTDVERFINFVLSKKPAKN